ncbi:unnamed protein product, partial [Timema podura]|nr:unnamed protein product [Timema podura]
RFPILVDSEINAKVKNAEIKLAEKRQLRIQSSRILEDIITKKSWLASQDGRQRSKTPVFGIIPVNLSDEWDRVHGSKWVLGLSIKNNSNTAIGADKIISIQRGHSAM